MSELTTFLLEQIAADEAVALAVTEQRWTAAPYMPEQTDPAFRDYYDHLYPDAPAFELDGPALRADDTWPIWTQADAEHASRHDPARVLAECAAKRRIVELHDAWENADGFSPSYWSAPVDEILRALASVYAGQPGFREEWS